MIHFFIASIVLLAIYRLKPKEPKISSALDIVPELGDITRLLVDSSPPNQLNNTKLANKSIEKFASQFYRTLGKESVSCIEQENSVTDLLHLKNDAITQIEYLITSSRRPSHRKILTKSLQNLDNIMSDAIGVARSARGGVRRYEDLPGVPMGT